MRRQHDTVDVQQAVGRPDMGAANPLYATDALRWDREQEICEVGCVEHALLEWL